MKTLRKLLSFPMLIYFFIRMFVDLGKIDCWYEERN